MLKKQVNKKYSHSTICISSTDSTNNYAIKYANIDNIRDIKVYYCPNQLNGRGLGLNTWHSENKKNLTFSLALGTDKIAADCQFMLTICISLSIKAICDKYSNKEFCIKWPNDIYYDDKKIAGILIENTLLGNKIIKSVIGVGLNINQTHFNENIPNPISLKQICNNDFDIKEVLNEIIEEFKANLTYIDEEQSDILWKKYHNALFRINKTSKYMINDKIVEGKILGVDKYGRLRLKTDKSELLFNYKEIKFIL